MYNYTNTALAILTRAGLITEEAAEKLGKEMASKIHPSTYQEALKMVDSVKFDQLAVEPWVKHFEELEDRLEILEKALANKTQKKSVVKK